MARRSTQLWLAAALILLTVGAHFPELKNGFIWDDPDYLTENRAVQSPGGLAKIWSDPAATPQYYPLVFTTFWAEYHLWGLNPLGYHLDNILLHAANVLLLWILLTRLGIPAAWLAAAIFAVHPMEVESVAWITERKNCLSGFFYLAAMLAYLRQPPRYKTAVAFFLAALLSKTVTATWPIAIAIILWWQSGRVKRQDLLRLTPLLVIGLSFGWLTAHLEAQQVGAAGRDFQWSFADRILIAGHNLWFYIHKLAWPTNLSFIYKKSNLATNRPVRWLISLAAAAVLAAMIALRKHIGRSPATVGLLYTVTLLPALGFVNVFPMRYSFVADHFQYLAGISLIVPAAVIIQQAVTRRFAWLVLVPLSVLTWNQAAIYKNPMTLWTATVAANPTSWMTHVNLGAAYMEAGDLPSAHQQYILAVQQTPPEADAWWTLGNFYNHLGRTQEAITAYRQAVTIDPNHFPALFALGELLTQPDEPRPQIDEGIADLRRVVAAKPNEIDPRLDLAQALLRIGNATEAEQQFSEVLRISPLNAAALQGLTQANEMNRP